MITLTPGTPAYFAAVVACSVAFNDIEESAAVATAEPEARAGMATPERIAAIMAGVDQAAAQLDTDQAQILSLLADPSFRLAVI